MSWGPSLFTLYFPNHIGDPPDCIVSLSESQPGYTGTAVGKLKNDLRQGIIVRGPFNPAQPDLSAPIKLLQKLRIGWVIVQQ
jgi:hypothetical protein